jgi:2'-phosphotransferase
VFETSYEAYPHIVASGGIQRAAGATHITFTPVNVTADGSESRPNRIGDADISIWVHLKTAMETEPSIVWQRTAAGSVATSNEVPKALWKKAVARRQDIGLLLGDGEVRKEVPEGLRGKGSKGKAKKGKGGLLKSRGGDASDSASDE